MDGAILLTKRSHVLDKVDDDHVGNEGDEHFLDDFDVNKKDEILSQFWVDLWPKLEEMGWSLIRVCALCMHGTSLIQLTNLNMPLMCYFCPYRTIQYLVIVK